MMLRPSTLGLGLVIAFGLTACGQGAAEKQEAAAPSETAAPSPLAAPAPAAAAAVAPGIRTAAGPGGSTVDLTRVQVTGNIMTVELRYTPPPGENPVQWVYLDLDQVSLIDDATSQRYGVLKDDQKAWMAAPMHGQRIGLMLRGGHPGIVWFKFPAPPASSPTVSLNIPDVSPFDGVPVQR